MPRCLPTIFLIQRIMNSSLTRNQEPPRFVLIRFGLACLPCLFAPDALRLAEMSNSGEGPIGHFSTQRMKSKESIFVGEDPLSSLTLRPQLCADVLFLVRVRYPKPWDLIRKRSRKYIPGNKVAQTKVSIDKAGSVSQRHRQLVPNGEIDF